MSNYKIYYYDIHGVKIKLIDNIRLSKLFMLYFGNFKRETLSSENINIEIIPFCGKEPLPIRVKGGKAGIDIETIKGEKENVKLYYNDFVIGTDLELIVNFTRFLLAWDDKCQVHAGAVAKNGKSYVFFAPQNTGKTTLVLYLLKKGYSLLSDDWLIIGNNGNAYFYPQPISIYDYNLAYSIDWCRELFGWKARLVQLVMLLRVKFKEKIVPLIPYRIARFGINWVLSKAIRMIPQNIPDNIQGKIHKAYWLYRNKNIQKLSINKIEKDDLINRVIATFMYEFSEYFRWYYLVAQEGKSIHYIENFKSHMKEILMEALKDINCYMVLIPSNTSPQELGNTILENISE